jgi:anti-anti-sigma factor
MTGDLAVVGIEGNLLREESGEFEEKVGTAIKAGGKKIVFNLEKCAYISSLNLSVLVWAKKQVAKLGGDVKIAGAGRVMKDLLKRTSLDQIFEIHGSVEDAARAFGMTETGP